MAAKVVPGITDDNDFIEVVNTMIKGLIVNQAPERVWIIQIDNWFDHKWLRFSGNGSLYSDIPVIGIQAVKEPFYRDKLTFPPFAPDRVSGQLSFVRNIEGYQEEPLPRLSHPTRRKRTFKNLQRRITAVAGSGLYLWYSANTLFNGRASIMVYTVNDEIADCWYASFERNQTWALGLTKGINRKIVLNLLA